ncbi:hypothetical protein GCM10020358_00670 [Amorphoplanes nipponensis]
MPAPASRLAGNAAGPGSAGSEARGLVALGRAPGVVVAGAAVAGEPPSITVRVRRTGAPVRPLPLSLLYGVITSECRPVVARHGR